VSPPLGPFKAPKRPPTRRSHLERLVHAYARDNDVPQAHVRHLISSLALIGALQRVEDVDAGPGFLIKGGVAMELRLGVQARPTNDLDVVFRGSTTELSDTLDVAFAEPYAVLSSPGRTSPRRSARPPLSGRTSRSLSTVAAGRR